MKLVINYEPTKFQMPQLSESNFIEVFVRFAHLVELNKRYQSAKFHWPRLSGSNFMRARGKHPPPPPRLTRSQKAQSL